MLERGTICGYRGKRLTASQRARFLQHGIDNWPIQNVTYRLHYLRMMFIVEALFILISTKVKSLATQDRHRYWLAGWSGQAREDMAGRPAPGIIFYHPDLLG